VAKGRAVSRAKTFLALLGLIAVPVTYGLVTGWNPLPGWADKLNERLSKVHSLAQPATSWAVRVGDEPRSAAVSGGVVVVFESGTVEGRDARTGTPVWTSDEDWAAPAGSGQSGAVVLLGTRGHGYRAVDPFDGRTRWSEPKASGAWTFSDLIVDITCPDLFTCTLRGRSPATGAVKWHASLDGNGRTLSGANRPLANLRPLDAGYASSLASVPRPAPPLLGFRLDDRVQVFSTRGGQRLRAYKSGPATWVTVAGDRVLVSTAAFRGGTCRFTVTGQDPASGRQVWQKTGWDLRTATGIGCDQRRDPVGGGGLVTAVSPDGRDALLDARTGDLAFQVPGGQAVMATDGTVIVLRGGDRVRAVRRSGTTLWTRAANRHAQVGLAPGAVLITDADAGRLAAIDTTSGRVLVDAKTAATVLGFADGGLVINSGRTVGLLPYGSVAP
jgi:outer membrane protein assembly factor BamB